MDTNNTCAKQNDKRVYDVCECDLFLVCLSDLANGSGDGVVDQEPDVMQVCGWAPCNVEESGAHVPRNGWHPGQKRECERCGTQLFREERLCCVVAWHVGWINLNNKELCDERGFFLFR